MDNSPLLIFLEVLALLIVPVSGAFTVLGWIFARRYWPQGARLPLVLAIVNTITFPIACYFGVLSYRALAGLPRLEGTAPFSALAVLVLDIVPLLTTGYLVWLEFKRRHGPSNPEEISPPPE